MSRFSPVDETLKGLPPGFGLLAVVNVLLMAALLPLVIYRGRRWWYRRSSVAARATAMAVLVLWIQLGLAWCWEVLPPVLQAVEISGGPGVLLLSTLQVVVFSLGGASRRQLRCRSWVVVVAATCVLTAMIIAVVVGGVASADLHRYRFDFPAGLYNPGLVTATVIANVYMAVVLVQMIWLGVRRADRSPAGWGLGLLATASAAVLVQVVHGGICNHIGLVVAPQSVWLTAVPSAIGGVCLLAGLLMPPLMLYWQARRKLYVLSPIRRALIREFPSVATPLAPGASSSDLVDEWCSQIEDGLTLTAQLRDTPLEGTKPPTALAFRADAVARWLIGDPNPALNCCWLNTPEETSGQDWVLAIAARYRRYVCDGGASGSPSTLRR